MHFAIIAFFHLSDWFPEVLTLQLAYSNQISNQKNIVKRQMQKQIHQAAFRNLKTSYHILVGLYSIHFNLTKSFTRINSLKGEVIKISESII